MAVVLHFTVPVQPLAVRIAPAPLHKLLLFATIVGAAGVLPVVIVTTFDTPLVPQLLLQVALYVPA